MNIAEIAKLAGVSSAAVSRYFNNGYISAEKKEAIRKVVEQTGYRPSVQAQTLRTKRTRMIGVIVPKIASVSIARVVEGILSVLNSSDYQMLLAVTENNPQKELEYLNAFSDKQVDGVVLVATILTAKHKRFLKKPLVPVVVVGQEMSGCYCVYHDDYHAAYDLTRYVLDTGRRKPGYIGVMREDQAVGTERLRAYQDAARDAGCEERADRYVIADFTWQSGYEKAAALVSLCGELDAVICATDSIAAGAMKYLRDHGYRIPEQILLAGMGDSEVGRLADPPLVTVHFAYEKSGELAAGMLLRAIGAEPAEVQGVRLGYELIGRERQGISAASVR